MTLHCPARFAVLTAPAEVGSGWVERRVRQLVAENVALVLSPDGLADAAAALSGGLDAPAGVCEALGEVGAEARWVDLVSVLRPVADEHRGEAVVVLVPGVGCDTPRWVEVGDD